MITLHKRWVTIPHIVKPENKKEDTSKVVKLDRTKDEWEAVVKQARKLNEDE